MPKKTWLKYALICVSLIFVIVCTTISYKSTIKTSLDLENNMVTHFIDVGQGDCALIQVNNKNLLIDSGTSDSKQKLIRYLKKNNITKLDYIVATHPHEDHIGGMASVIKNFEVGEFYAPKAITSTQTFNDMIDALRAKNLKIKIATPNISLNLGPNATCVMLSPNKTTYDNLNNYSCTLKISYKNSTYLFTGDIETQAEQELIANDYDLSAQVLKVAHHGSKTSSSKEFLAKVSPKIAVISCGIDNDYGHPNRETLDRLKRLNTIVYRTDLDKTIVLISDGSNIKKLTGN
ncbi:ComEC/Rec2 family competence protein [Clostridium estertheticum]|uniref:ComEC/Rec2 family competence protein n=1 Tax=Clostridium estertheticum TaxID=238834 RepID=UPI001C6EF602|nr:ComEC/Rec2 family competence protein [Clostridium estertheticum]MBW9151279.1 MBL fold metallo-hydrolase [Clostridium estertheticum]WLC84742.1 MBL fold metallo-hydrolase [Clostridium estertheticum]